MNLSDKDAGSQVCFRSLAGSLRRCPVPGGSLSLLPGFVHCPEKRSPASAGCLTGPRGPWSPTQIARAKMAPGSRCFALMLFSVVVDFASLGKLRVFRRNRALIWSADLLRGCVFRRSLVMRGGGGRGGGSSPSAGGAAGLRRGRALPRPAWPAPVSYGASCFHIPSCLQNTHLVRRGGS